MKIVHGWKKVKKGVPKIAKITGFYLVDGIGDRYFISEHPSSDLFELCCKRYLLENEVFWIDYCYGQDLEGNLVWKNLDQTYLFHSR